MTFAGNISIERKMRLRWRFDFADKPTRCGIWNNAGGSQDEKHKTSAWSVNKTGLIRAAIEAEYFEGWRVETLAECDGHDFVNFSWVAATPIPWGASGTFAGQVVGLTMTTRELDETVLVDGSKQITQRTEADKGINLAGF